MNSFLYNTAVEILKKYSGKIGDICIVFPSRRACVHFKNILSQKLEKPSWSPLINSIQDFIAMHSPWIIADNLELVFELYECYKKEVPWETFDRFYPWGLMLLNDYDEIDRNLVEADYLFRIVKEHKKTEETFGFSPAESEEFLKFWRSFSNKELTAEQKDFMKTWEIMGKVYHKFRKRLMERNICYEGMAYRRIYEILRENMHHSESPDTNKKPVFNYHKIIFAGFNQLNAAEEHIIKELVRLNRAEFYLDADEYYVNNKVMEAGRFLRNNLLLTGNNKPQWIEENFKNDEKEINIIGAVLKAGQAKALGHFLKSVVPEKTAVVLPDESMLIPVLHSIPENIKDINVTMGYPFKNTPVYNLLNSLKNLDKNKKGNEKTPVYYYKDCIDILNNPLIRKKSGTFSTAVNEINRFNIIYITSKRLSAITGEDNFVKIIFQPLGSAGDVINYLVKLFNLICDENMPAFEKEFFFRLNDKLNLVSSLLLKFGAQIEVQTVWNIIIEAMTYEKIPFEGEPLKGLQVMGLLETRSLDFENVYILSMNEGTVPRGRTHSSYIPYHLRRAFRMPTYEDDDAAFAYYFYRILQRAKKVFLIYNTETTGLIPGEKSRFILQIENELPVYNKKIIINNRIFRTDFSGDKNKDIEIPKSTELIKLLSEREYSASALAEYITCPLKFYFSKAAGIEKEDPAEEAFTGASFGNLLHEIMSRLYRDYKDKSLTQDNIEAVKKLLESDFDKVWENACSKIPDLKEFAQEIYGKNLLFKNVIQRLTMMILENDARRTPFVIKDVEGKIKGGLDTAKSSIKLTGRLDRIEESDGITNIIDYKTGAFNMKAQGKKTAEEYFEKVFSDPDYKEAFQQYFYAMLFGSKYPDAKINIGIYPLRAVSGGIQYYERENGYVEKDKLIEFTNRLKLLLNEILNPEIPFKKTNDIQSCKYCNYNSICYRE